MTGYYPSRLGMQFVPVNDLEPVGLSTKFTLLPEVKTNTHIVLGISYYPNILYSINQSEF